ncbi:MAG TPA: aminotransferase class I/II-fold pyridoxal phosphate-dependent enzyme [Bryobacteraceae bacterium]
MTKALQKELIERGYSRRHIGQIALGAAAAIPLFHEFAFAQDAAAPRARGGRARNLDPDAIYITSNENPMGPTKEGLEAISHVSPLAWRYGPAGENAEFESLLATTEDVPEDHVLSYPGSGTPLANLMPAFTSPTRSWVMGQPGYTQNGTRLGVKIHHVPLRKDFSHDVEAMIKADPNAGVYYICNPNNPTGTLTPRKDFEYILANKKKDAILVIDEAYVHFSGRDNMSTDMVKAGKDVVVLRTFSKLYGMAGLRAGMAYGRPDLLAQLEKFGRARNLSVATMACAAASMKAVPTMMPERIAINKKNRELAFEHMDKLGVTYTPSVANFFMMSVKGMTGPQIGEAMKARKINLAGNRWPEWPNHIRVTVGTYEEMTKFNAALSAVVQEGPSKVAKAG